MICFLRDTTSYDFTELKWKLDWYVRSVCMPTYDRFHTLLQSLVVFNIFILLLCRFSLFGAHGLKTILILGCSSWLWLDKLSRYVFVT